MTITKNLDMNDLILKFIHFLFSSPLAYLQQQLGARSGSVLVNRTCAFSQARTSIETLQYMLLVPDSWWSLQVISWLGENMAAPAHGDSC